MWWMVVAALLSDITTYLGDVLLAMFFEIVTKLRAEQIFDDV